MFDTENLEKRIKCVDRIRCVDILESPIFITIGFIIGMVALIYAYGKYFMNLFMLW